MVVIFMKPGHIFWVEKEAGWIEFSPENEAMKVMAHVGGKMKQLG